MARRHHLLPLRAFPPPSPGVERAGYTFATAGENIASGSPSAQDTVALWMGSAGHCANLMNPDVTDIGVGAFLDGSQHLWTQTSGSPRP